MQRSLMTARAASTLVASSHSTPLVTHASAVRAVRCFTTFGAATAGQPQQSASATRSSSFLSRHPKKIAMAAIVTGGVAYMATKAATPAPASALPSFRLSDHTHYKDLNDFKQNQDIVLYQYETCPFCNKVRAFLDYTRIRYRVVEVNPMTKEEKTVKEIPQLAAIKEVPVLTVNGKIMTDSTPIIRNWNSILNHYREKKDQHVITPEEEASLTFVDQRIVILTAPNIYRTLSESIRSFDYIARNSQLAAHSSALKLTLTKYVGAVLMYLITEKKLKKKYGITEAREEMYKALREWSAMGVGMATWLAGNNGAPFRGGSSPNLADLTCFGVMRSLQNYDAGRDIMNPANTSPEFIKWYRDVEERVKKGIN